MSFLFFIYGLFLGVLSGLIPGLHSNTLISILSSISLENQDFALLIIALLPVNIIISFIPSIFFGIPDQNTVVSVLPGHRMVLEGRGLAAVKVIIVSVLFSVLIASAVFSISMDFFSVAYLLIQPYMKYIVLFLSMIFIMRTKNPVISAVVFIISGFVGISSFNSSMEDKFLPMFSGMFAIASMLNYGKQKIPEQKDEQLDFDFLKFSFLGVIAGAFADLFPGISSASQVAVFLSIFVPMNSLNYLAAISSISVSEALFSLSTAVSIGKARMGATSKIMELIPINENLQLFFVLFIFACAIAALFVYFLRKRISSMANTDFSHFNILLIPYLIAIVFIIDGFLGIFIMVLGTALGYVTIRLNVERTNLMGAIILPTLLLLFRIFV